MQVSVAGIVCLVGLCAFSGCGVDTPANSSGLAGRWVSDQDDFIHFVAANEATVSGGAFGFRSVLRGVYWASTSLVAFHFTGGQSEENVWFFRIERRGDTLILQEVDGALIERLARVPVEDEMSLQQVEDVFDLLKDETIPTVSLNELVFEYRRVE